MEESTIENQPELVNDKQTNKGGVYLIKHFDKPKPPNYDNTQMMHELGETKQCIDMMQK